jgi:hypothetical protein
VETVRAACWTGLIDQLYEHSWQEPLGRFRSNYAFRGMSNADYQLQTSLERLGGNFADLEGHLLRNFRKYAYRSGTVTDTVWNWLAVGQHHGLPTRLYDWTYSPFVALHFATEDIDHFDADGAVWCVDYVRAHRLLPQRLKDLLHDEGSNVFTVEMLQRADATLDDFDTLDSQVFVLFFEPPSLDDRIINQYALFSTMSQATASLHGWLEDHPSLVRKVIIPHGLKWEVRDKLDQANVNERVLFPGLDGLSQWLRRQYTPRQRPGQASDRGGSNASPIDSG